MKKILFLFLAACFFFSCEKETIVIPQQHAGRTVLAFFWADNSLNSSLRNNIQTMMQGLQAMKDSAALLVTYSTIQGSGQLISEASPSQYTNKAAESFIA